MFWEEKRSGQQLVLDTENGEKITLGAVRQTRRGFDAFATTLGYDPGRATKGLSTLEEAKTFVVSFEPWNMFDGGEDSLPIEPEVRPFSN